MVQLRVHDDVHILLSVPDLYPLAGLPFHGLEAGVEEAELEPHLAHLSVPVVVEGVVHKGIVWVLLGVLEGSPSLNMFLSNRL